MAVELHVFLQDQKIPTRDTWQRQIELLEFPTELDPSLDVRRHSGYRPSIFRGASTGFEFYLEPADGILDAYPHIRHLVASRNRCATFRWSGDPSECGAALCAAAALANAADGIYFYPDDDLLYDPAEAVEATRRDLDSI